MIESDPAGLPEGTSRSLDDLRKEFEFCLDALYWLGRGACDEIRDFDPDLLLVLAHGGWGVLWAIQVCWQATQEATLPLVLATNLGREKIERYYGIRDGLPCVSINPFVADYAQEPEVGYFLDWVSQQIDWQEQLRSQVLDALDGRTPRRILVLDDTTWEGGIYRLALIPSPQNTRFRKTSDRRSPCWTPGGCNRGVCWQAMIPLEAQSKAHERGWNGCWIRGSPAPLT
jgi:hypothetical protein